MEAPIPQEEAQDLSMNLSEEAKEGKLHLFCPVDSCQSRFMDSNALALHVQKQHFKSNSSRCPHCSYCLTNDERGKEHWLSHHQDVCAACVLVFTSVYGPQLWKKVHVKPSSMEKAPNAILTVTSRKRRAPGSGNESMTSDSEQSATASTESDHQDSDAERQSKRSRKQSCPKKVIAVVNDDESEDEYEDEEASEDDQNSKSPQHKRKKTRRCIRCPDRPIFASRARLRLHRRTRHRIARIASAFVVAEEMSNIEVTN
jgi:hypothetical protein